MLRIYSYFLAPMLALSSLSALTIDIYVENINFANDGYNFYTDSSKTTELNFFEGTDTLNTSNSYRFFRLGTATSHPFYVSDDQANASNLTAGSGPSSDISLTGDGSYTSGIGANQEFTLSFNAGFDVNTDKLYYYCTAHPSSMVAEFTVVPEPETYGLLFGTLVLALAVYRRRKHCK